jgi:hypothetical protein
MSKPVSVSRPEQSDQAVTRLADGIEFGKDDRIACIPALVQRSACRVSGGRQLQQRVIKVAMYGADRLGVVLNGKQL